MAAASMLVVAAACVGCGGGGGDGAGSSDDGVSESVESRRPMPSCGAYEAPLGEPSAEDRAIRDCFLAAFREGREAEVAITVTSLEGDPIITIYRVLGPSDVELFVDASADTFSPVKTYHQRCTAVAEGGSALVAENCVTLG